jgi:hypothetical protein
MQGERAVARRGLGDPPWREETDLEAAARRKSEGDAPGVRPDARALTKESACIDRDSHQTIKLSDV